jgi:hypothetical protein
MPKREHVKISVMGSAEEVRKISRCDHEWISRPAILLDYIESDYQCTKCGTWKSNPKPEKKKMHICPDEIMIAMMAIPVAGRVFHYILHKIRREKHCKKDPCEAVKCGHKLPEEIYDPLNH